jgi:hypothetical protein
MARDNLHWAIRSTFTTAGPKSGKTSSTFYFLWNAAGTPGTSDLSTLIGDVGAFWNGVSGGASFLTNWLGPQILRGSNKLINDAYSIDLDDPHHAFGSPYFTKTTNLAVAGNLTPLPNEVALTASYRAAYGSDPEHDGITRPRASDRGRIYIGPFNTLAMDSVTLPNGTIEAVVAAGLVTAASTALSALNTAATGHNFTMSVWSRREHLFKTVADKSVDNSFDTQRRREVEPPGIQTWVAI